MLRLLFIALGSLLCAPHARAQEITPQEKKLTDFVKAYEALYFDLAEERYFFHSYKKYETFFSFFPTNDEIDDPRAIGTFLQIHRDNLNTISSRFHLLYKIIHPKLDANILGSAVVQSIQEIETNFTTLDSALQLHVSISDAKNKSSNSKIYVFEQLKKYNIHYSTVNTTLSEITQLNFKLKIYLASLQSEAD